MLRASMTTVTIQMTHFDSGPTILWTRQKSAQLGRPLSWGFYLITHYRTGADLCHTYMNFLLHSMKQLQKHRTVVSLSLSEVQTFEPEQQLQKNSRRVRTLVYFSCFIYDIYFSVALQSEVLYYHLSILPQLSQHLKQLFLC